MVLVLACRVVVEDTEALVVLLGQVVLVLRYRVMIVLLSEQAVVVFRTGQIVVVDRKELALFGDQYLVGLLRWMDKSDEMFHWAYSNLIHIFLWKIYFN